MSELVFFGILGVVLYLLVFDTDRFNKINQAGYDNVEKTGKLLGKGAKTAWTIFRLFRR